MKAVKTRHRRTASRELDPCLLALLCPRHTAIYRNAAMGGYCDATVIMVGGKEISGRCLVAAVNHIESELADQLLPPEAA